MTATLATSAPTTVDRAAADGRRAAFLAGARAMLPWLVGVVPFGLTIGVTIAESSLDPITGWLTGPLVYAGSAQLIGIGLLDHGAAPIVVVATILVVNARLVVYSGAMAPRWANTTRSFRAVAAYLLIDPSFAVGAGEYDRQAEPGAGCAAHFHYLGAGLTLWVAWQTAIGVGIVAGDALPDTSLLALVVPYYLIAEVVRVSRTRPAVGAAVVGAAVAVAASSLPMHSGAAVAIVAGVAVAARIREVAS